ncbi:MAG: hypothetical protein RIB67_07545 [Miltoncostaeaceae bacterium]
MPGPAPKPAATRQRRNRTTTAARLIAMPERPIKAPPLPAGDDHEWHPLTLAWWKDIWTSPMAPEFLAADVHGLYMLAMLVDRFWRGDAKVAGEIRLQRQCFGLTPIDRRRLQWEVERVEEAEERRAERRTQPAARRSRRDPRKALAS